MNPIQQDTGLANHGHEVELSIRLAETVVRSGSKHQPVLDLLVRVTCNPSFRFVAVRVGVCFGVVGCRPHSRDHHGALFQSIIGSDWEILLGDIGNKDDWRAVSEAFLDDGPGPDHGLEHVHVEWLVAVTTSQSHILLANLVQEFWTIGHDLEQPGASAGCGILGCKKKGQDGLGDFKVCEFAKNLGRFLGWIDLFAPGNPLTVFGRILDLFDPRISDACHFTAGGHADL